MLDEKSNVFAEFIEYCRLFGFCPEKRLNEIIKQELRVGATDYANFTKLKDIFSVYPIQPNVLDIVRRLNDKGNTWMTLQYTHHDQVIEIEFFYQMKDGLIDGLHPNDIRLHINGKRFYTQEQKDKRWLRHLELEEKKAKNNERHQAYLKDLKRRKAEGIKTYREMTKKERLEYEYKKRQKNKDNRQ